MEYALQPLDQSTYYKEFPTISPDVIKKFQEEVKTLQKLWDQTITRLNQNDNKETVYKTGTWYKIYESKIPVTATGVIAAVSGTGGTIACIFTQAYPIITIGTMFFSFGGILTSFLPHWHQKETLEAFEETRAKSNIVISKIENIANLINKTGELVAVWESIKKDPSRDNLKDLDKLFKVFDDVQRAEVGCTTLKVNEIEKLFLFDNLYHVREIQGQTDIKLIEEWKTFIQSPQIWATEIIQPIEFSAIRASRDTYNKFLIFHESKNELQVDSKVALLRDFIKRL